MAEENKNKKNDPKRPKPTYYWIYIAIALLFLGLNFFGGGSWSQPAKTNQAKFETFLRNGDVEKVNVINKKIAKVYLTEEAKKKEDRKSTRLNSSHVKISYAVFCLKKKITQK